MTRPRAPEVAGGCAELVAVESWRVDDAPTLSSTQTAARNLNRRGVPLVLESVTWLVMWSCVVRLRRCCDHAVEARGWVEEALPALWGRIQCTYREGGGECGGCSRPGHALNVVDRYSSVRAEKPGLLVPGAGLTETGFYSRECRATGASWASRRAGDEARGLRCGGDYVCDSGRGTGAG